MTLLSVSLNVPATTNTYAAIEELSDAVFAVRFVSYRTIQYVGKWEIIPELHDFNPIIISLHFFYIILPIFLLLLVLGCVTSSQYTAHNGKTIAE
jgi:hypothetical protein